MPFLQYAEFINGARRISVPPTQDNPIPQRFDFADPVGCAKMVCAVMSKAGGRRLLDCRVRLHLPSQRATVVGEGFQVYYGPTLDRPLAQSEVLAIIEETSVTHLGNVKASPDRWEGACWVPSQLEYIPPAVRVRETAIDRRAPEAELVTRF